MAPRLLLALPATLLAILGGACSGGRQDDAVALRRAFADARAGLLTAAPAAVAPAVGSATGSAPGVPAGLSPAAAAWPGTAAQLLGARPDAVQRWLGEPTLRRREGTAEVWLYAGPACALDLVLYPDRAGLSVAHAAARASGTEPRTEAACLGELGRGTGQVERPLPSAGRLAPDA